jgi:hypothetical protein
MRCAGGEQCCFILMNAVPVLCTIYLLFIVYAGNGDISVFCFYETNTK